jgi:hypothetical protein
MPPAGSFLRVSLCGWGSLFSCPGLSGRVFGAQPPFLLVLLGFAADGWVSGCLALFCFGNFEGFWQGPTAAFCPAWWPAGSLAVAAEPTSDPNAAVGPTHL